MRTIPLIALAMVFSACSTLDEISFASPRLDPNKIYLGSSRVDNLRPRDTQKYGCANGPLLCVQRGVGFECSCP